MNFNVVIPARYASTRLPAKPLLDIAGKPMVVWVAEKALASGADHVVVATDDIRIFEVVTQYGYQALMTKTDHQSGTDRIAEVAQTLNWLDDVVVVNVQGDEPLISIKTIRAVAERLTSDKDAVMSTACYQITNVEDFKNPNVVKVVVDENDRALYFSRAPIPYPRDVDLTQVEKIEALRHIGIYGYKVGFLKQYSQLKITAIERIESLEQLRVLNYGYSIVVHQTKEPPEIGVDTQEDLDAVRRIMTK